MVAAWHHHDIVIFHRHGLVQTTIIGINALKREPLRRIQAVVVRLFQLRFARFRRVVLMRRVA
ncbi:hypothetical protein D3C85_1406760 [compost metagenome]